MVKHAPEAVLIVASNPVDAMTHLAASLSEAAGVAPGRVFGTGTTLDTSRFRSLLGNYLDVSPQNVHDHRSVLTVSGRTANIAGISDVTLSLPRLVGREGLIDTLGFTLSAEENLALGRSAAILEQHENALVADLAVGAGATVAP